MADFGIISGGSKAMARAVVRFYYDHNKHNFIEDDTLMAMMEAIAIATTAAIKYSREVAQGVRFIGALRYTPKAPPAGTVSVVKVISLPSDELVLVFINDTDNSQLEGFKQAFPDRPISLLTENKNEVVDQMLYPYHNPGIESFSIYRFDGDVTDLITETLFVKVDGQDTPIIEILNEHTHYGV